MKRFINAHKKALAAAAAAAIVISSGIGAYGYFTDTGNGTGSATVGASSHWVVTSSTANAGAPYTAGMQPGVAASDETITYHVKNAGLGVQHLNTVTLAVLNNDGTTAYDSGTASFPSEVSCTKADFNIGGAGDGVTYSTSPGVDIAPGVTNDYTVKIHLDNLGHAQDNCQSTTPPIYISAS